MEARVTLRKDTARLNSELSNLHRQRRELLKKQQQLVSEHVREAAPLKRILARTQTTLDVVNVKYAMPLQSVEQELDDLNGKIEGAEQFGRKGVKAFVRQLLEVPSENFSEDPLNSDYSML